MRFFRGLAGSTSANVSLRSAPQLNPGFQEVNVIGEHVLGYFQGATESTFSATGYPKRIVLLQHNIERWSRTRAELVDQVHDTVLHEVAHYFGMDHDDIEQSRLHH